MMLLAKSAAESKSGSYKAFFCKRSFQSLAYQAGLVRPHRQIITLYYM